MNPVPEPNASPKTISALVRKCEKLCEQADHVISSLSEDRETFLAQNLGDALQQLELILRVLEDESCAPDKRAERHGFLRRLFGRAEAAVEQGEDAATPDLDVPQQGLQGNSWTISLAELLSFLASSNKTGVLWVDTPEENFLFGLVDGRLMHATSNRTPEGLRLGEVLVGLGYLTRRQLERFLETQEQDAETISGENLLAAGMITDKELRAALSHQVQRLFYRLLNTQNAVYRFREGMRITLAYQVDQNVNQLLLESARVQDERGQTTPLGSANLAAWKARHAGAGTPGPGEGGAAAANGPAPEPFQPPAPPRSFEASKALEALKALKALKASEATKAPQTLEALKASKSPEALEALRALKALKAAKHARAAGTPPGSAVDSGSETPTGGDSDETAG